MAATLGHLCGIACQMVGLARGVRGLGDGGGQLLHAGCGFLKIGGGLLGACGQIVVAGGDFGRGGADGVHAGAYIGHQAAQLGSHGRDGAEQVAELVMAVVAGGDREIALRNGLGQLHGFVQRLGDGAGEGQRQAQSGRQHQGLHHPGQPDRFLLILLQLKAGGVALLLLQLHKVLQRIGVAANGTQILLANEVAHGFDIAGQLDLARLLVQRQDLGTHGCDLLQGGLVGIALSQFDDLCLQCTIDGHAFADTLVHALGQRLVGGHIAGEHALACGLGRTFPLQGEVDAIVIVGQSLHAGLQGLGGRVLVPQRDGQHHGQKPAQSAPQLGGDTPLIELHWLKILQKHCLAGANWWSAARPGSVVSVEKEAAVQAQHRSRRLAAGTRSWIYYVST